MPISFSSLSGGGASSSASSSYYLLDSATPSVTVPAGVYQATSTGNISVRDSTGSSFFVTPTTQELAFPNGISTLSGIASLDPETWKNASFDASSASLVFVSIVKDAVGMKAIAANGAYATSTDGSNWTYGAGSAGLGSPLKSVKYENSTYYGISESSQLLTSTDLATWSAVTLPTLPLFVTPQVIGSIASTPHPHPNNGQVDGDTVTFNLPGGTKAGDTMSLTVVNSQAQTYFNSGVSGSGWSYLTSRSVYNGNFSTYLYRKTVSAGEAASGVTQLTNMNGYYERGYSLTVVRNAGAVSSSNSYSGATQGTSYYAFANNTGQITGGVPNSLYVTTIRGRYGYPSTAQTYSANPKSALLLNTMLNQRSSNFATFSTTVDASGNYYTPGRVITTGSQEYHADVTAQFAPNGFLNDFSTNGTISIAGGGGYIYSTNGTTWVVGSDVTAGTSVDKTFFDGTKFWLLTSDGTAYYSTNATSWTSTTISTSALKDISYSNDIYVVTDSAGLSFTSVNGTEWTQTIGSSSGSSSVTPGVVWQTNRPWYNSGNDYFAGFKTIPFKAGLKEGDTVYVAVAVEAGGGYQISFAPDYVSEGWQLIGSESFFSANTNRMGILLYSKTMETVVDSSFSYVASFERYTDTVPAPSWVTGMTATAIRGVDHSAPVTASDYSWSASNTTTHDTQAVDYSQDSIVMAIVGNTSNMYVTTWPTGYDNTGINNNSSYPITIATSWKKVTDSGTEDPAQYVWNTSGMMMGMTYAVPLTAAGAVAGDAPSNTVIAYRNPSYYKMGSGSNISTFKKDVYEISNVLSDLTATDYISQVESLGTKFVALTSTGAVKYSGSVSETILLKSIGTLESA